jgi:hypothetical protein
MSATCGVCSGAIPSGENVDHHTALCAEVVRQRLEVYRNALEEIREMMSPKNRERFVMQGPLAFVAVYNAVETALSLGVNAVDQVKQRAALYVPAGVTATITIRANGPIYRDASATAASCTLI